MFPSIIFEIINTWILLKIHFFEQNYKKNIVS